MKRSKFSETQIISIFKAVEGGRSVRDVCREHEVSDATYYKWKSKYGGMQASDIKRLRGVNSYIPVNRLIDADFRRYMCPISRRSLKRPEKKRKALSATVICYICFHFNPPAENRALPRSNPLIEAAGRALLRRIDQSLSDDLLTVL